MRGRGFPDHPVTRALLRGMPFNPQNLIESSSQFSNVPRGNRALICTIARELRRPTPGVPIPIILQRCVVFAQRFPGETLGITLAIAYPVENRSKYMSACTKLSTLRKCN